MVMIVLLQMTVLFPLSDFDVRSGSMGPSLDRDLVLTLHRQGPMAGGRYKLIIEVANVTVHQVELGFCAYRFRYTDKSKMKSRSNVAM